MREYEWKCWDGDTREIGSSDGCWALERTRTRITISYDAGAHSATAIALHCESVNLKDVSANKFIAFIHSRSIRWIVAPAPSYAGCPVGSLLTSVTGGGIRMKYLCAFFFRSHNVCSHCTVSIEQCFNGTIRISTFVTLERDPAHTTVESMYRLDTVEDSNSSRKKVAREKWRWWAILLHASRV